MTQPRTTPDKPPIAELSPERRRVICAKMLGVEPRRRWRVYYDKERQHASIDIPTREEALARRADAERFWKDDGGTVGDFSEPEEYDEWDHAPRFDESHDDAFALVDWMRAKGWGFIMSGAWAATFFEIKSERTSTGTADTAPKAIVNAFLVATGGAR